MPMLAQDVTVRLTRQLEVLQHLAQGFVYGHVAVVAFIDECMHHRHLQVHIWGQGPVHSTMT